MSVIRVGMLHLDPRPGDISRNRQLIEHGLEMAAAEGAQWVLTPELCVCGYNFAGKTGLDWILPQPDGWMASVQNQAQRRNLTIFLSHPERVHSPPGEAARPDGGKGSAPSAVTQAEKLYNSIFVIGPTGEILGVHRKVKPTGGMEAWSSAGDEPVVVDCGGIRVGLLICADAWFPEIVQTLREKGADLLVSSAAWPPVEHGPEDCWERRTEETGLPLWVCNRTGREEGAGLDYRHAESTVSQGGRRLLAAAGEHPTLLCFDWDMDAMTLSSRTFSRFVRLDR